LSIAPSTSEPPLEPKLPVGRKDKLTDKPTENGHSDFVREPHSSEEISQPADFWNRAIMFTAIFAPFLGFVAGVYYSWTIGWMGWPFLVLIIATWCISGMGVTIGFHRLATHSSFETYRPLRAIWMMMGALSIEGSPLVWCAVHRRHHQKSDRVGDPHSPNLHGEGFWNACRGFVYGHCGWLLTTHWSKPDLGRYVPDLLEDKFLIWVDKFYYLRVLASLGTPALIGAAITQSWHGALLGFLWGGLVRTFMGHHITWSINSVCHMFGGRPYKSADLSTNNLLCALFGFGEGWHNNHHAFPTSARHGLRWWQLDVSWLTILLMQKLGLAWNVKVPTQQSMAAKKRA
jgi:stearoyl-CoA desaturase (delta-9 desaturase)